MRRMEFNPEWDEPRKRLFRLLTEKGISFAKASSVIGKNKAYLQQYLQRGNPRHLPEGVREGLARFLNVSPDEFRPAVAVTEDLPLPPRELLRMAIVATVTSLRQFQSLDALPSEDLADAIMRTYKSALRRRR